MDDQSNSHDETLKLAEEQMRMAAERTYLAWVRTGLTSVGFGIAIARFVVYKKELNQYTGHWIGQFLIIWGICVFVFALLSYKKSFRKLKLFKSERYPILPLAVITGALIVFSFFLFLINMD